MQWAGNTSKKKVLMLAQSVECSKQANYRKRIALAKENWIETKRKEHRISNLLGYNGTKLARYFRRISVMTLVEDEFNFPKHIPSFESRYMNPLGHRSKYCASSWECGQFRCCSHLHVHAIGINHSVFEVWVNACLQKNAFTRQMLPAVKRSWKNNFKLTSTTGG